MKLFRQWWDRLTLWAVARRRALRDCPEGNDLVVAILLRRSMDGWQTSAKDGASKTHHDLKG